MPEYSSLEKIRLQKIDELRAEGIDPYPGRAARTHTSTEAIAAFEAAEKDGGETEVRATVTGRLRSTRVMGKVCFAHLEDGYGSIQLFLRVNDLGEPQLEFFTRMLDLGDFVQAS